MRQLGTHDVHPLPGEAKEPAAQHMPLLTSIGLAHNVHSVSDVHAWQAGEQLTQLPVALP